MATIENEWLANLGISDRHTGMEKARSSGQQLTIVATSALFALHQAGGMTQSDLVMLGLATREQGLHQASVAALEANNPYAAYTLIRALAENAAATEYALAKPKALDRLMGKRGASLPVGTFLSHAMQSPHTRFGKFKDVYHQLSRFAHPTASSIFASMNNLDHNGFQLSTAPSFTSEMQFMAAAGYLVVFAQANADLLAELAAYRGEDDEICMHFHPITEDDG